MAAILFNAMFCSVLFCKAQVESLLYVAVALATTAKIYHTKRETLQTAKEMFSVPLMYDPRFQRSPFDALGRSMRLGKCMGGWVGGWVVESFD